MSKNNNANMGRNFGLPPPIEDSKEYEKQMDTFPLDESRVIQALTSFASLCQFLSEREIEVPSDITRALHASGELSVDERVALIRRLNQELLEYIHLVSTDSGIRM